MLRGFFLSRGGIVGDDRREPGRSRSGRWGGEEEEERMGRELERPAVFWAGDNEVRG